MSHNKRELIARVRSLHGALSQQGFTNIESLAQMADSLEETCVQLQQASGDLREARQLLNLIAKRERVVSISNSEIGGYECGASFSVKSVTGQLLITPKAATK